MERFNRENSNTSPYDAGTRLLPIYSSNLHSVKIVAPLQIDVLGRICVLVDGQPLERPRTRKDLWLLAYLALRGGTLCPREELHSILWPEMPDEHARDNLRHSLWRLRKLLGTGACALETNRWGARLSETANVDATRFRQLAASDYLDDLVAASTLWRGTPLAGIDSTWADDARLSLEEVYRKMLSRLTNGLAAAGLLDRALEFAIAGASLDPYDEEICRSTMRLLADRHPHRALLMYQQLKGTLRRDLDVDPEPETASLERVIRGAETKHMRAELTEAMVSAQAPDRAEELGARLHERSKHYEALALLRVAASGYEEAGDIADLVRVALRIGKLYADMGAPEPGINWLNPVVARLEQHGVSVKLLAQLHSVMANLYHAAGNLDAGAAAARRAVTVAGRCGDPHIVAEAEAALGLILIDLGQLRRGTRILEEAIKRSEGAQDHDVLIGALHNAAWSYETMGRLTESMSRLQHALCLAENQADQVQEAYVRQSLGRNHFYRGDWTQARTDLTLALLLSPVEQPSWVTPYSLLEAGRLSLAQGLWAEAETALDMSVVFAEKHQDLQALRTTQRLKAEHDLLHDQPDRAVARLEGVLDRPGLQEADVTFVLPILALAYLQWGDIGRADDLTTKSLRRSRQQHNSHALLGTLRVRGMVCAEQGNWEMADQMLARALQLSRAMGYPYAEARALHTDGVICRRQGRIEQAEERLHLAMSIFQRLGAEWDADTSRKVLAEG
jgi:DNA-binding SARP family transcriptional activator/Tfp pilus assembly protein PilF